MRLLVIDRDARVRQALRALIEGERDIAVVGEAARLDQVIRQVRRLKPDVILLDLSSSEAEQGCVLLPQLTRRWSVVVMSMCGYLRNAALAAGACAFFEEDAALGTLLEAIREAAIAGRCQA